MKEALDAILSRKNKGIFVVDAQHHLEGIVSVSDLTNLWTADEVALEDLMSRVPLANIIKTTRASLLHEAPFHPNGKSPPDAIPGSEQQHRSRNDRDRRKQSGGSAFGHPSESFADFDLRRELGRFDHAGNGKGRAGIHPLHTPLSAITVAQHFSKVPASRSHDPRSRRLPHQRNGGRSQSAHCQNTLPYLSGRQ